MKVKDFLSVLNLQVKYEVVDRFNKKVLHENYLGSSNISNRDRDFLTKEIYMVFPNKEHKEILTITIY